MEVCIMFSWKKRIQHGWQNCKGILNFEEGELTANLYTILDNSLKGKNIDLHTYNLPF